MWYRKCHKELQQELQWLPKVSLKLQPNGEVSSGHIRSLVREHLSCSHVETLRRRSLWLDCGSQSIIHYGKQICNPDRDSHQKSLIQAFQQHWVWTEQQTLPMQRQTLIFSDWRPVQMYFVAVVFDQAVLLEVLMAPSLRSSIFEATEQMQSCYCQYIALLIACCNHELCSVAYIAKACSDGEVCKRLFGNTQTMTWSQLTKVCASSEDQDNGNAEFEIYILRYLEHISSISFKWRCSRINKHFF